MLPRVSSWNIVKFQAFMSGSSWLKCIVLGGRRTWGPYRFGDIDSIMINEPMRQDDLRTLLLPLYDDETDGHVNDESSMDVHLFFQRDAEQSRREQLFLHCFVVLHAHTTLASTITLLSRQVVASVEDPYVV